MTGSESRATPSTAEGAGIDALIAAVVPQVARARTLVDANPLSATHGCADRAYWHYRTLTNFPGANWQQLMLGFAALYRTPHRANPYCEDPELLFLTAAMLRFWARECQHRDGAFDEWYLNEHSYCVTAITSAGVGLTLHILGDDLPAEDRKIAIAALERAGGWLSKRYNPVVMNQNLAAATALRSLAVHTGNSHWEKSASAKLDRIGADQNAEGWLPEYSGADFGYSTLSLDQLAAFCLLSEGTDPGDAAHGVANRLVAFLSQVQGAANTMPGPLGSRGTSHLFPFGALAFRGKEPGAGFLATRWLTALARGEAPTPQSVDDRYFAYFYFPQFALALWQGVRAAPATTSANPAGEKTMDLPESGLLFSNGQNWSVSVSRRLGGAVAFATNAAPHQYHLGYEVQTEDGKRYSSAAWEDGRVQAHGELGTKQELVIEAPFRAVKSGVPLRKLLIPFQITIHLLINTRVAELFHGIVKGRMISSRRSLPLRLRRRIAITGDGLQITDELIPARPMTQLRSVGIAREISMHSPSAKSVPIALFHDAKLDLQDALVQLKKGQTAVVTTQTRPLAGKTAIRSRAKKD